MPKPPKKTDPLVQAADSVTDALSGFDYGVDANDFVLYELHRLIEEERASFDDAEFRTLIDEGIRAHIEENVAMRARLAGVLRTGAFTGHAGTIALRVVHALEDLQSDLCNAAVLVRSYTAYLLSRLETLEGEPEDERISGAADLLFESTGDRDSAETALSVLCADRSAIAARVLAHAVSEPLLDEDLEAKAVTALKTMWPLPRRYMLYNLQGHMHEDLPLSWFQLFIEKEELSSVDLVLEELRAHGENPEHREDLSVLLALLDNSRDPELEDKILGALNAPDCNPAKAELLRAFLEEHQPVAPGPNSPWVAREQALALNREYIAAAALFERGESERAREALDSILARAPAYPFAVVLKSC